MALFTDGLLSQLEDLTAQDTQLMSVASVEGIDVSQKLRLAQEDLALEIETLLKDSDRSERGLWLTPSVKIGNVAVTPAMKQWHTFHSLELVYTDAYASQLSDRYAVRRDQFAERSRQAYEKLRLSGIGVITTPVSRASEPQVLNAQGALADGTYYVAAAWINSKGQEGAASTATAITTLASTFVVQSGTAPENATAWNVYVGVDPQAVILQNGPPINVGQIWTQPDAWKSGGRTPGCGQAPDYLLPVPRTLLRG